jgi:chemotaxis protein methyltransferase CheR
METARSDLRVPSTLVTRRFVADRMVARLARWLRLAGEDVAEPPGASTTHASRAALVRMAMTSGRTVLTRDRSFPRVHVARLLIRHDALDEQLAEFYRAFPSDPRVRAFTRCGLCNGELIVIHDPAHVAALPALVLEQGCDVARCVACGHMYWEGSHTNGIRRRLATLTQRVAQEAAEPATCSELLTDAADDGSERLTFAKARSLVPGVSEDDRGWMRFDAFLRDAFRRSDLSWAGFRRVRRSLRAPVARRMREIGVAGYGAYLTYIDEHPEEAARLGAILTVPITRFFRDREDWRVLAREAFPTIVARAREAGRVARALSIGCASGEEPYTLRLLWHPTVPLDVVALDVRDDLLERARNGLYSPSSVHSVPPEILARAFTREGKMFRLERSVVDGVRFVRRDLSEPLPAGPWDIISCRNLVLTYLGRARQEATMNRVAAALEPGGFLMVGGNERLPREPEAFGLSRAGRCVYRKA